MLCVGCSRLHQGGLRRNLPGDLILALGSVLVSAVAEGLVWIGGGTSQVFHSFRLTGHGGRVVDSDAQALLGAAAPARRTDICAPSYPRTQRIAVPSDCEIDGGPHLDMFWSEVGRRNDFQQDAGRRTKIIENWRLPTLKPQNHGGVFENGVLTDLEDCAVLDDFACLDVDDQAIEDLGPFRHALDFIEILKRVRIGRHIGRRRRLWRKPSRQQKDGTHEQRVHELHFLLAF